MLKRTLNLMGVLAALLLASCVSTASLVAPTDSRLQYAGRIDFTHPGGPQLSWPGTSIEGNFSGTSLAIKLDDQLGNNYFNVFVDGDNTRPIVVRAEKGSKRYLIATGLAPGAHSFKVTKRTEGENGATVFEGLELGGDGKMLAPPQRKQRRIEFYGDSITSGMGNEAADRAKDNVASEKNSFMSYAAITARNLDAEAHVISHSGIGVMVSWFPFTMPDYYDQLSAVGDNDTRWDFSRWTPDVVVVNLLQNDSWLVEKRMAPPPDDSQRVRAYRDFVAKLRAHYPQAYIVCALGSMDAVRPGSKWPGYVRTAVEQMQREGDQRIDTLVLPFTGYTAHPRVRHHQANAALLTAFVKARMGW